LAKGACLASVRIGYHITVNENLFDKLMVLDIALLMAHELDRNIAHLVHIDRGIPKTGLPRFLLEVVNVGISNSLAVAAALADLLSLRSSGDERQCTNNCKIARTGELHLQRFTSLTFSLLLAQLQVEKVFGQE